MSTGSVSIARRLKENFMLGSSYRKVEELKM
jgi:hypothetical protein